MIRFSQVAAAVSCLAWLACLITATLTNWQRAPGWMPPAELCVALGAGYLLRWGEDLRRRG